MLKKLIGKLRRRLNKDGRSMKVVVQTDLRDFTDFEKNLYKEVAPKTMTSPERVKALSDAVKYIISNNIKGDIVECGVWKGGSVLAILKVLIDQEITDRDLHLFDTFEGMNEPTHFDVDNKGESAKAKMEKEDKNSSWVWAKAGIDEVKENLSTVTYPSKKLHYIKGKVEDTLSVHKPDKIALLRLDTDWYESTKVEMIELYDNVVSGGIIIIDDYGHWDGCRKAIDEFIHQRKEKVFLNRIDYTGRLIVKP